MPRRVQAVIKAKGVYIIHIYQIPLLFEKSKNCSDGIAAFKWTYISLELLSQIT